MKSFNISPIRKRTCKHDKSLSCDRLSLQDIFTMEDLHQEINNKDNHEFKIIERVQHDSFNNSGRGIAENKSNIAEELKENQQNGKELKQLTRGLGKDNKEHNSLLDEQKVMTQEPKYKKTRSSSELKQRLHTENEQTNIMIYESQSVKNQISKHFKFEGEYNAASSSYQSKQLMKNKEKCAKEDQNEIIITTESSRQRLKTQNQESSHAFNNMRTESPSVRTTMESPYISHKMKNQYVGYDNRLQLNSPNRITIEYPCETNHRKRQSNSCKSDQGRIGSDLVSSHVNFGSLQAGNRYHLQQKHLDKHSCDEHPLKSHLNLYNIKGTDSSICSSNGEVFQSLNHARTTGTLNGLTRTQMKSMGGSIPGFDGVSNSNVIRTQIASTLNEALRHSGTHLNIISNPLENIYHNECISSIKNNHYPGLKKECRNIVNQSNSYGISQKENNNLCGNEQISNHSYGLYNPCKDSIVTTQKNGQGSIAISQSTFNTRQSNLNMKQGEQSSYNSKNKSLRKEKQSKSSEDNTRSLELSSLLKESSKRIANSQLAATHAISKHKNISQQRY